MPLISFLIILTMNPVNQNHIIFSFKGLKNIILFKQLQIILFLLNYDDLAPESWQHFGFTNSV